MFRSTLALVWLIAACPSRSNDAGIGSATPEPLAEGTTGSAKPPPSPGYVGVLTPKEQAAVPAPFTTTVREFAVNLGDVVEKGAVLAKLDDQPLRDALATATAEVAGANAALASAGVAERNARAMYARGVGSLGAVQEAAGRSGEAAARLKGARANLDAVKTKLEKTTLTAPIAGKVALRYIEPGGRVDEGRPVLRIISTEGLFLKFAIPGEDSGKVAVDDMLDVDIDARGSRVKATAKVRRISPELDPIAQMIIAEADLVTTPPDLQSGLVSRIHPQPTTKRK